MRHKSTALQSNNAVSFVKNKDNVWVIDEPEPITDQTVRRGVGHKDGFHRLPNDTNLGIERRLHIRAAELDHLRGVQTFGYTVSGKKTCNLSSLAKVLL